MPEKSLDPRVLEQSSQLDDPIQDAFVVTDEVREAHEVFQKNIDGVDFRSVSWQRATIIFLKIQFAMSILAVPASLATLGAVGGSLSIVGWEILNTYTAVILGDYRNRHPDCHSMYASSSRRFGVS